MRAAPDFGLQVSLKCFETLAGGFLVSCFENYGPAQMFLLLL
jgi:hypothetical protein